MIKGSEITNFKLYKETTPIPFSNLNLLTGVNGRGKSSVLQVFLLLSQSALQNRATEKVILNGVNVRLGAKDDVKNKEVSTNEPIIFSFLYDDFKITYTLRQFEPGGTELDIEKINCAGRYNNEDFDFSLERKGHVYEVTKLKEISGDNDDFVTGLYDLFIDSTSLREVYNLDCSFVKEKLNLNYVHYVSADRSGPKNYYENRTLGHFVNVGAAGQDTINVYYHKQQDPINPALLKKYCELFNLVEEDTSTTIEDHTNYWLSRIFNDGKVKVEAIQGEDILKVRMSADNSASYFKPTNVGYGFSYSLPIIVSGLIAKPGEILIVENPEAHLHPYAQSIIAKFLSLVSSTGVQVIVESHSEHILNGFRISVYDKVIDSKELNILYFDNIDKQHFKKIDVSIEGEITNWPENFFDQATKDLNYLFGM